MTTCPNCGTRYSDSQRLCPHDGAVLEPDHAPELGQVGKVLEGKYRIDGYLSRGGMGAVYRGTHVMLGRPVAVKLISPDLVSSPDMVRRFQREARAVTHLDHPHIVKVYDLGQTSDGTLYIAMDLVAGESLNSVIKKSGALAPDRILTILGQVASALALAHRHGVVHRDLKPHNIMIGRDDNGRDVATLLDFGIAKTFEFDAHTKLTATGSTLGTPHYMSPEQASGVEVDARSDLYSVGIILYEMLVGEVPFTDPSTPAVLVKHLTEQPVPPSARRPDLKIPAALEAIALRCLEKAPAKRFQTAAELGTALSHVVVPPADYDGTVRVSPAVLERAQNTKAVSLGRTESVGFEPAPRFHTIEETVAHATRTLASPPGPGTLATVPARELPVRPIAPTAPPQRSALVPIVAAVVVLAALGGTYWAMTQANDTTNDARFTTPPTTTPAAAVVAVEPQPQPPAAPLIAPALTPPQTSQAAPPPATPPPAAPPAAAAARPAASQSAPAAPAAPAASALSRQLHDRLQALLAERKISAGIAAVTLEMTTRPSGLGRGITADYAASLRTSRGEKTFSGSHLGFAELALRTEVIDKVAGEMAAYLAAP